MLDKWIKYKEIPICSLNDPKGLSIIIPARNEEDNIVACLYSVITSIGDNQRIEIIVIDDHSEDTTLEKIKSVSDPRIIVLNLAEYTRTNQITLSYKKAALNYGISNSNHDYILQIDADVTVGSDYFDTILSSLDLSPDCATGPVLLSNNGGLLGHFQTLDMLGMMALTCAGISSGYWHMANGANMLYKKHLGAHDVDRLASGDDVYLIQKISSITGSKILFIKNQEATILTKAQDSWTSFYQQRIRWATKNKLMSGWKMQLMMAIPFVSCIMIVLHIPLMIYFSEVALILFFFHLITKVFIDYPYLKEVSQYYDQQESLKYFFRSNLIHILYISTIGLLSLVITKYHWKGRKVK